MLQAVLREKKLCDLLGEQVHAMQESTCAGESVSEEDVRGEVQRSRTHLRLGGLLLLSPLNTTNKIKKEYYSCYSSRKAYSAFVLLELFSQFVTPEPQTSMSSIGILCDKTQRKRTVVKRKKNNTNVVIHFILKDEC